MMSLNVPYEVSYIRPRDPSIQNFNRGNLKRINLKFSEVSEASIHGWEEIPIYLRIKPCRNIEDYKIHHNQLIYKTNLKNKETVYKKISFTKIFSVDAKQVEIFDEVVKLRVFEFLNGKDATLFSLGTVGAGKTYTTIGDKINPGYLPRSLEYIFKTLPNLLEIPSIKPTPENRVIKLAPDQKRYEMTLKTSILRSQKPRDRLENIKVYQSMQDQLRSEPFASIEQLTDVSLGVWVSFVEICNEEIYDLLDRKEGRSLDRKKLRIGTLFGKPYIKDLTYVCVLNGQEAYQVYQYGMQKLESSKSISHSIFTIKLALTKSDREAPIISSFNICNLASTDELKASYGKTQIKESNSVNNSLMVLGMCINKLEISLKKGQIDFNNSCRDSKLSQLFQRALHGLDDFCIIININPSKDSVGETQNIFNFSALTKTTVPKEVFMKCNSFNCIEAPLYKNNSELEKEMKMLQDNLYETISINEDFRRNKENNINEEKQALIEGWKEMFEGFENLCNIKKKHLKEKYESLYLEDLNREKCNIRKKMGERQKYKEKLRNLKLKLENTESILKNKKTEISQMKEELNHLSLQVQGRNKLIIEYEASLEDKEMNSFLMNEISFELDESIHAEKNSDSNNVQIKSSENSASEKTEYDQEDKQLLKIIDDSDSSLLNEESIPELVSTHAEKNSDSNNVQITLRENSASDKIGYYQEDEQLLKIIDDSDSSLSNEESLPEQVSTHAEKNSDSNNVQITSRENSASDKIEYDQEDKQLLKIIDDSNSSLLNEESLPELVSTHAEKNSASDKTGCDQEDKQLLKIIDASNLSLLNEESLPELVSTLELTQTKSLSLNKSKYPPESEGLLDKTSNDD